MIGAGGMGEVYKARDSRLERDVAIKVLPAQFAGQPDMRQRFEREARSISMLHHPHICGLYDIGNQDGIAYLVMEYLEGEPLDRRLARGPMPHQEALEVAIQIAGALDQAHQKGLIHRDLKPGNVMLTTAGAKLLDFGLAKAAASPSGSAIDATVTNNLTMAGSIVGTLAYMSPERLEGNDGDARGDIFAAGAVFYEMLTGRRAFPGDNQASIITAVMSTEPPPVSQTHALASPALDRVVRKCMARQPDQRWQTARDLMSELQWIASGGAATAPTAGAAQPATRERSLTRLGPWAVAAASLAALGAVLLFNSNGAKRQAPERARLEFPAPDRTQLLRIDIPTPSPDGRRIVFFGHSPGRKPVLWIRDLDSAEARSVPGVQGGVLPFWAPDGRRIGFLGDDRKLWTVNLDGGSPAPVAEVGANFGGGTWNQNDVIVFGDSGKLMRVAAAGGTPAPIPIAGTWFGYWPIFLPDGKHILFNAHSGDQASLAAYVLPLAGGAPKRLLEGDSKIVPSWPGWLLYNQGGLLFSRPFSASKLDWDGQPTQLASGLFTFGADTAGASYFSSWNGVIAYRTGATARDRQMAWFDRLGQRTAVTGGLGRYSNPALSPDGRWLAVCVEDPKVIKRDIWVYDLKRGTSTRLTSDPGDEFNPSWSPDGRRIAYTASRKDGEREIYIVDASGADQPEQVSSGEGMKNVEQWSPDGKFLLYNNDKQGNVDLMLLALSAGRRVTTLLASRFREDMGRISPNGRWIAYRSNESGRDEIYVRALDATGTGGGRKWLVSTEGGSEPEWRRDGKELFYVRGNALTVVDVSTVGPEFDAGTPRPLFEKTLAEPRRNRFLASPDGQQFLLVIPPEEQLSSAIQVILDVHR
jgi:Tol biopolymer transport system component/predicted Ser/Thr protein kinase